MHNIKTSLCVPPADTMPIVLTALCVLLVPALCHMSAVTAPPAVCEEYAGELYSRPDFTHKLVTASLPLPPDFSITAVTPDYAKGRSFYWCEMKVRDMRDRLETLRRFGHNATHWWVTKGCGGWFIINACRADTTTTTTTTTNSVAPATVMKAPSAGKEGLQEPETPKSQLYADIDTGALLSLQSWLGERGSSIEDKLGADPQYRVIRSVDDEFSMEFGGL